MTMKEIVMKEIVKKIKRLKEQRKMQEMKEAKMIEEAAVVMHPKQKKIVEGLGMKYVIFPKPLKRIKYI